MHMRMAIGGTAVFMLLLGLSTSQSAPAQSVPSPVVAQQSLPGQSPEQWQHLGPDMLPADGASRIDADTYHKGHGPNLTTRVVLTYDDCPRSLAAYRKVVEYAAANNIGLVMAPTGKCYERFLAKYATDIAALARQHGQYVINHSETHPLLTKVSAKELHKEISGNIKADYGRPPYGDRNTTVDKAYAKAGMRQWLWDVDTNDWKQGRTRDKVVAHVVAKACEGCTVLMHLQHKGFDVTAIARIKAGLEGRGLRLCRAFRGWDNMGPVETAPAMLGDKALPC